MIITQIKSKNEYNFEDNPDKDFMTNVPKLTMTDLKHGKNIIHGLIF